MGKSTRNKKRKASGKAAADAAPTEPKEYIAHVRERAQADLNKRGGRGGRGRNASSAVDTDLEHLVRTVRAILSTNTEIWESCKGSKCVEPQGQATSASPPTTLPFQRVGYTNVTVKTECASLYIETTAERMTKDFECPGPLPEKLTDIIAPKMGDDGLFPNYDRYLDTCLLLHEDVLAPFLVGLKDHLEDVQVFLGSIHAWLAEPIENVSFVEKHFGKKLNIPEAIYCDADCEENHDDAAICVNCKDAYCNHDMSDCYSHYTCDSCRAGDEDRGSFPVVGPVLIKECPTSGNHTHEFDLGKETDKERLIRFLEFVSCP